MNYTQDNDKLYRYLFQNRAVRGEWVRLNQTFTDTLNTHHYPKAVQNLLGEMMVATNLLTATLKFNGNITVQIQGDGPLKLALVNGNDQQQIRALARVQGNIQDGMSLRLTDGLLETSARRVTQYVYNGDYGSNKVKFGAYYGGSSKRNIKNVDLKNNRKNTWGTGLIFEHEIDSIQNVTVAAGFTREISENANKTAYYSNAYALGLAYNFVHTTYGLDLAHKDTKNKDGAGNKVKNNEVTAVIRQGLNEDWNVYAMYSYKTEKTLPVGSAYSKSTDRQFLVGTEYYVYNQGSLKVKPFLEWQATRTKYENDTKDRSRDFKTVIGLRAYW